MSVMSDLGHSRRLRPLRYRSALPSIADLIADIPDRQLCARTGPEEVQQMNVRQRDYSITSSARASNVGGMSRPSALAARRLRTSSSLVVNSIGRSPGLAPLR